MKVLGRPRNYRQIFYEHKNVETPLYIIQHNVSKRTLNILNSSKDLYGSIRFRTTREQLGIQKAIIINHITYTWPYVSLISKIFKGGDVYVPPLIKTVIA